MMDLEYSIDIMGVNPLLWLCRTGELYRQFSEDLSAQLHQAATVYREISTL